MRFGQEVEHYAARQMHDSKELLSRYPPVGNLPARKRCKNTSQGKHTEDDPTCAPGIFWVPQDMSTKMEPTRPISRTARTSLR